MPHLQLDVGRTYPVAVKKDLALRLGQLYAQIMQTNANIVDVTIREVGEGGVWRIGDDGPVPSAVLSLDIRRGRPPEQRARLASALIDACAEKLGLDPTLLATEFTQHAGDEIFLKVNLDGTVQGYLGRDWSPEEEKTPFLEGMKADVRRQAAGEKPAKPLVGAP